MNGPLPGLLTEELPGTGGRCRAEPEDFCVEEIPLYGPTGEGQHTLFEIEKRGIDTLHAIGQLARALDVPPNRIASAGLKDAQAVTRQHLSVEGVSPDRVRAVRLPRVRVLWAQRHRNRLKVGHLRGNRFRIRLRGVVTDALNRAEAIAEVLRRRGLPNGFGPQRFGARLTTHLLGRALILGDWDEFLRVYLGSPRSQDQAKERSARLAYDRGDLVQALTLWPGGAARERAILQALSRGEPPRRAVLRIPRRLRRLFVAGYQAYLFNRVLDARLGSLDLLRAGDLAVKHDNGAFFLVECPELEQPRADRLEISPSGPLYGYKVRLAAGVVGETERALLDEEGLRCEDWRVGHGVRLKGARRPFRVPIDDLELWADDHDLVLHFTLPSGAYATNLLREVMKAEVI